MREIQSLHHNMEDLEEESKEKARDTSFSEETFQPLGYVPSLDHAEKLISSFEAKNTVKFSCYKADKNFAMMVIEVFKLFVSPEQ